MDITSTGRRTLFVGEFPQKPNYSRIISLFPSSELSDIVEREEKFAVACFTCTPPQDTAILQQYTKFLFDAEIFFAAYAQLDKHQELGVIHESGAANLSKTFEHAQHVLTYQIEAYQQQADTEARALRATHICNWYNPFASKIIDNPSPQIIRQSDRTHRLKIGLMWASAAYPAAGLLAAIHNDVFTTMGMGFTAGAAFLFGMMESQRRSLANFYSTALPTIASSLYEVKDTLEHVAGLNMKYERFQARLKDAQYSFQEVPEAVKQFRICVGLSPQLCCDWDSRGMPIYKKAF